MGQYWLPVNLDKREFVDPHKLGAGLKLFEQLANHPGTGAALILLTAALPETRGGGDFDLEDNWHGAERTVPPYNASPGPMPKDYPARAKSVIGRWAGDRIALVGDYAKDGDLPAEHKASEIYCKCRNGKFQDITDDVCAVIEHELQGKFEGENWREFKAKG